MSRSAEIIPLPTAATNRVRQGGFAAAHAFRQREGCIGRRAATEAPAPTPGLERSPALLIALAMVATADEARGARVLAFLRAAGGQKPDAAAAAAIATVGRIFVSSRPESVQ